VEKTNLNIRLAMFVFLLGLGHTAWASDTMVGVYYYPWHTGSSFHGGNPPGSTTLVYHLNPGQRPELGWYSQLNSNVISQHYQWARYAGIKFFVNSYWGRGITEDYVIKNCMFDNPDRGDIKLCVFLEPVITPVNPAITAADITAETEYLCDNYFNRPGYFRIDGKPVIFIYLTRAMSDPNLTMCISTIRAAAINKGIGEVYIVGDEVWKEPNNVAYETPRVSQMDAITNYDVYGNLGGARFVTDSILDDWQSRNISWKNFANGLGKQFIPAVSPGFNDRGVRSGHQPCSRKLNNESNAFGTLFSGMLDRVTADTNMVMVTSWNEWHEDTQIEPVAAAPATNLDDGVASGDYTDGLYYNGYSTLYLNILRIFTREGKVDIIQVLDRSGSMGGYASSDSTDRKIDVLKLAADQFIQLMKPDIGNQLGLVQFNQNVVPFGATLDANLAELTTARANTLRDTTVPSIEHGGRTSIGDGLREALNQFPDLPADSERDQVILLVTDGKENEPEWIDDVNGALIDANIAVYPLGLGYGSGINEEKLTNLAGATGGTYRITSDELIFRKLFIEILAGALDWAVIVDPIGELAERGVNTVPVTITGDQSSATFTAYWEGIDDAIDFTLITPSGGEITPATDNNRIRYGKHPRYAFYQLDFPLNGSQASDWAGRWKMKLAGTDRIPSDQKARYSASAFAEGGARLEVTLGRLAYLTGKAIPVKARLIKNGKPLIGARVDVYCDAPVTSVGNLLYRGKVGLEELRKERFIKGDRVSLIDRKLQILSKRAGIDILRRKKTRFELFDDGKHGDGKAKDGIYANSFAENQIPGSYTFRFVASKIPAVSNITTTREWTTSFYNKININPKYSQIDVKQLAKTVDGWRYSVIIVPKDRFDNYLEPGHQVMMTISYPDGKRQILLTDNIDGTYTKDILFTKKELKAGAKLRIDIDGKKFTDVEKTIRLP